tara:strand:+ start:92 stop:1006 length:915 start_codon:yes stop_codon:yes gene_type:complete
MENETTQLDNNDEIDLRELISALWNSKLLISSFVISFAIGFVLYSLSIPNQFTSSSLLKTNDAGSSSQSTNSSLGVLGSIAGVDFSGSGKSGLVVSILESRDFLKHLLKTEGVLPSLTAIESYDRESKKIIFNPNVYNKKENRWIKDSEKPSYLKAYKAYRKILNINIMKSGFIQISVTHQSPEFAKYFLVLVIDELNSLSRVRDLKESNASLKYLYRQLQETKQSDIKISINQLIKSELRKQMLANVQLDYLLKPLDSAFTPELKTSPNRPQICINGTILGLFLGILISLIRYYGFRYKKISL